MTAHPRYRDQHGRIWEDRDGPVLLTHDPDEHPDWGTMQAIHHAYGPLEPVTVPEPTEQAVRRKTERQRHEDMMRLVGQLSPETRQRIAHRLDGPFHELTGTKEPEMSEPTNLHDRILEIIETEWLRPYDPDDHAGDTPGARAYDAARHVTGVVLNELDQRTATPIPDAPTRTTWPTAKLLQDAADKARTETDPRWHAVADHLDVVANNMAWLAPYREHETGYPMWTTAEHLARALLGEDAR